MQSVVALTTLAGLASVLATVGWAETAPQIAIKTKAVAITVTVDPALRAYPGLFEDSLAEGRRWAERNRGEADKTLRTDPMLFRNGQRWTFERSYDLRSVVGRYVSVLRDDGTYTGGAHPNSVIDTILWDRDARRRMNIRPFFRETADHGPTMTALARLARIAVAADKLARDIINVDVPKDQLTPERLAELDRFIADGIAPTLIKLGPISLAPSTIPEKSSGLTFHYSPYAVGPYAEGPFTVFVRWTAFDRYLSPLGLSVFDGDRPASDKQR